MPQTRVWRCWKVLFAEEYPELKFLYTTDKAQAYKDVDFVFCQIRSGGFDMRMWRKASPRALVPLAQAVTTQEHMPRKP